MLVDYATIPAPATTLRQDVQPAPTPVVTFPKPWIVALLAFVVGVAKWWHMKANSFSEIERVWFPALLAFPCAAYLGTLLVQRLALRRRSIWWRIGMFFLCYLAISLLSSTLSYWWLAAPITRARPDILFAGPFSTYVFMASVAPVAFAAFAVALGALVFAGHKLPLLVSSQPQPIRSQQSIPLAVLLGICALVIVSKNWSDHIAARGKDVRAHLLRAGLLTVDDEEHLKAAIKAIQAGLGDTQDGTATGAVREWLVQQPTRDTYIIAGDGTGHFATFADAYAHLGRVEAHILEPADVPIFTLAVRPGRYEQTIAGREKMRIVGDGPVNGIEIVRPADAAVDVPTIEVTDGMLVRGLTIRGGDESGVAIRISGRGATVEGNDIRVGRASSHCALWATHTEPAADTAAVSKVNGNTISGGCGVLVAGTAQLAIERNAFWGIGRDAIVAEAEARATIDSNGFTEVGHSAVMSSGNASVVIAGGEMVNASSSVLIALYGHSTGVVRSIQLRAPATNCIKVSGNARLEADGVSFLGCGGMTYPPIYVAESGSVTVRNSTFSPATYGYDATKYAQSDGSGRASITSSVVH